MNRDELQNELLLYLGQETLPSELQEQLEGDPETRAWFEELRVAAKHMGSDDDFAPFGLDEDRFVSSVERQIAKETERKTTWFKITDITSFAWQKALPVAAAILLVLGVYELGQWRGSSAIADRTFDTTGSEITPVEEEALDDQMVSLLLWDYGEKADFQASEQLLNDLTDEELEYLEKNFDVGELLL